MFYLISVHTLKCMKITSVHDLLDLDFSNRLILFHLVLCIKMIIQPCSLFKSKL